MDTFNPVTGALEPLSKDGRQHQIGAVAPIIEVNPEVNHDSKYAKHLIY